MPKIYGCNILFTTLNSSKHRGLVEIPEARRGVHMNQASVEARRSYFSVSPVHAVRYIFHNTTSFAIDLVHPVSNSARYVRMFKGCFDMACVRNIGSFLAPVDYI